MTDRGAESRQTWMGLALALFVAAAEIVGTELAVRASGGTGPIDPIAYLLLIVGALPLAVRDRYPVPVLLIVAATTVPYVWLGYPGGFYTIAIAFAMWACVAAGHRLVAAAVGLGLVGVMAAAVVIIASGHVADADAPIWFAGWLVASFVLGEVSRSRREYLEQVEQRALDAERTREEEARRRAGEERMRIARELHDVLAHNISMINVQASVAVHLLDRQPEQARIALIAINEASKEALRELRATLGVLRGVDEEEPRAPAPGLARIEDVIANARAAGLDVTVTTTGDERPLPAGADLAAYRIVQESLTNIARHATAERVAISLHYDATDVTITVDDDGSGPVPDADPPTGSGITGMQERATAAGGDFEAGPRNDGGFRVQVRLPLGSVR
jgi:signal transduction histidine kinase